MGHVVDHLEEMLHRTHLFTAVRAVKYGITLSTYHFFAMLDMYNPNTTTFFTPSGELGFALHEMFEVSGLSMGEVPYEEYVSSAEEL